MLDCETEIELIVIRVYTKFINNAIQIFVRKPKQLQLLFKKKIVH